MKTRIMKKLVLLLVFAHAFALIGCQKEEEEIITNPPAVPENIIAGSPLARLLARTSQNPTQLDNVLDNCSGFSVKLPVVVTVNSTQLTVNSTSDYQTVQDIKNNTPGNDIVYFTYPITVVFKNYTSQTVNTISEFQNLVQTFGSDDGLNEIDCISINYPIVINAYNINNQIPATFTFTNNTQFYNFINALNNSTIAAIVYPISGLNSDGNNVVINSNAELENFIENSIDDCDDDVGSGNPTFIQVLTTGTWYVSYFEDDDDVETSDYLGFNFVFLGNGSIEVTKNSVTTTGSWSTFVDGGLNKIDLSFLNTDLDELEDDWIILEHTASVIRLKNVSGGNGETDYLNFTKI
jgi:hypothetical protein